MSNQVGEQVAARETASKDTANLRCTDSTAGSRLHEKTMGTMFLQAVPIGAGDCPLRFQLSRPAFVRRSLSSQRGGSTYFIVMAVAAVASIAAFATLAVSSASRRQSQLEAHFNETNISLRSSLDWAMESLKSDHQWRTTFAAYTSPDSAVSVAAGDSQFKWYLVDPVDGNLANEPSDPVQVFAIGESGDCRRQASAILLPAGRPLDVLRAPVHATGNVVLSDSMIFANGPLSCDGTVYGNSHTIFGSLEYRNKTAVDRIHYSSLAYTTSKKMPSELVFSVYESIATKVDYDQLAIPNKLENQVVSNANSPGPGTDQNVHGVYLIDVPASTTFQIKNTKITGTLLIRLNGTNAKLEIADGVHWNPQRADFPSLIVQCVTDSGNSINIKSEGHFLNPFDGTETVAHLSGVFHIIRPAGATSATRLATTNVFRGAFLICGNVNLREASLFSADPGLITQPPIGYQTARDPTNLLENTQFDAGLSPWIPLDSNYRGAGTRLDPEVSSEDGSRSVKVSGRQTTFSGIAQDVTEKIEQGVTYTGSVTARMAESSESLEIELHWIDDSGTQTASLMSQSMTTNWATHSFSFSVNWTGELQSARLCIHSADQTQDFYLDQVSIPVAGTAFRADLDLIPSTIQLD